MSTLSNELKDMAMETGFVSIGITKPEMLRDLPYGWVGKIRRLNNLEEELQTVKSVILLAWHSWDKTFNLNVEPPKDCKDESHYESHYFSDEIMKNKAWGIVDFLHRRGFDAKWSVNIPLKTAAVKCGVGSQGKNTLLISPVFGPRIKLIAILTDAILDIDSPFERDLCGDCDKCVKVCPTNAIEPYRLNITHCMVYSAECPGSTDVPEFVRKEEQRLFQRPTPNSYIECTRCMDVCPIGKKI
ncbi:MAG: 4Fe-4S binding protein [Candidatus Thorarchaeota archaeon]|nr:4Fe-4S binding protein [Candidatus Thorarchaeota archaeon]